jgi:hypothetical protein
MSLWADLYEDTPVSRPTSKIDKFKKQQTDNTKVGKVEQAIMPKVAGALEAGSKKPILGAVLNPAMRALEFFGEKVVQPITQGVSTALLTPQAMAAGKGNPIQSFRFAREQSKKISMGQALATTVGQAAGKLLPDQITPSFMDSDFDVFDDKKRDKAFRDEWLGIFASGATDMALALVGTKGVGTAVRAGTKKVVGPSKITTAQDMNAFRTQMNDIVADQALPVEQRTRSGLSVLVDDLVNEKDVSKLSSNPLVSETANPYRTATIVSRLDNHQDVADYLLAERGDTAAFLRFFEKNPLKADHLDNYGIQLTKPISSFEDLNLDELSPKLTERYQRVIDAKKATDRDFANALDDFLNKTKMGVLESYTPGKFASIESLNLARKKIANQAQFGDLKLFGKDGNSAWKVKVYQSEPYDRLIRVIAWTGSGRPQGHINISNPRRFEAANDLRSDLNRVLFLKGAEGAAFKRDMVNKYLQAQDDTTRAIVLTEIEQEVLQRLAKRYGVTEMMDVRTTDDAIKRMKSWHSRISDNRSTLKSYAAKNGYIPEDGALNHQNFISVANEAQTLPMLDFAKLERDVIMHLRGTGEGLVKPADARRARFAAGGVKLGEFLDLANMAFSNLNLLRLAYIPKNSMVDPIARASMALESTELVRNSLPGMSNFLYNSSLRAERLKRFVPGSPKFNARKIEKQARYNIKKFRSDLEPKIAIKEAAEQVADDAEVLLKQATAKRDRLKARAAKSDNPDVHAAYHAAEDDYLRALDEFTTADNALNKVADEINGYAKLIEVERQKLLPIAFQEGELKNVKMLGMEDEVITSASGKKYTIAGLADPNQRGVGAYMAEVDSSQNFYSASMQSEIARRVRYDGSRFVKIKRSDGDEYWNALAHIANRQVRNELDMPVGMMLRGDSQGDVLKWLYSPAGKEYRRRMESRYGRPMTKDDFAAWIDETQDKLMRMYPSEELRSLILSRNVTPKEISAALEGRLDLLESIDGPSLKLSDLNNLEKGLAKASGALDAAWKVLAYSENRMARNPLFLAYARDEMKTLINAAERSGISPSDLVVNNELRQIAYRNALARVERTLYSSRRLTNGMYMARYAMSFPLAFFNSQYVALRLMARNPMNAYWYNSIATAMDKFEAYEDQDGNTYRSIKDVPPGTPVSVKFPLHDKIPGWLQGALKPYTDARGGGVRINPKQLEFMVADPSVSWFGSTTISELIKDGFGVGPWKIHGEELAQGMRNVLGDDVFESSVIYGGYPTQGGGYVDTALNTIFPGYGKSLSDSLKLMFGKDGSDRAADEIMAQWKTAYAEWDRNGRVGNPPTPRQAAKAAGVMMFIRAVTQFSAPISVAFDPVTRAATTYYADLVEEYKGDYDKAQKKMIEDWGIDSLALIGSSQRNNAGLAATQKDIKIIRNFEGLLESLGRANSKYAGMLSSGYDSDLTTNTEYSTEIAAIYKRLDFPGTVDLPITERKKISGAGGIQSETEARRGWAEYQKAQEWRDAMMYQYGIPSTQAVMYERSGIKAEYDKMVDSIAKDFPGWTDAYNNNREDYWRGLIPTVEKIVEDTKWRAHAYKSGDKWEEIAYWVDAARRFKTAYDQPINTDERKFSLKAQFSQFHYDFLQTASDEFAAFAYRWLNNIPELNEEIVVSR